MKLEPLPLAIAAAISFAVIWALCSALVFAAPGAADAAFGAMMHADMPMMHVTLNGFLIGLGAWAVSAAVTAFVLALAYNAMAAGKP